MGKMLDANGVTLNFGDKIRTERGATLRIDDSENGPRVVALSSPSKASTPLGDLKSKYYKHTDLGTRARN